MATAIIQNRKGSAKAVIRVDSTATIPVANLAADNTETISSANITKLYWSTNGSIAIARGANTILTLFGSDHWDFHGISLNEYSSANLVFTVTGGGTMIVEVAKSSNAITLY